jgi:tetrapyrrole methylase family protein/MazG family protein
MKEFDRLIKTIRILRSPRGCPWDRAQKIDNYKKYLLEEAYELIEEIDRKKIDSIEEELGDLFLILIVITEMFREKGKISLEGVLKRIDTKIIHRHPHVFSGKKLHTKEEVLAYWIKHKAKKKKRKTIKDRLPQTAPALFLTELFFKEYAHKNKSELVYSRREINNTVKAVFEKLKMFTLGKNKEKLITDVVFLICRISFLCRIDLENSLRRLVIKKSEEVSY